MEAMNILASHVGTWTGTNGFRLMPTDPLETRPADATIGLAAGGHLTLLGYRWEHPSDGEQDGVLLLWTGEAGDSAHAVWADSWHQQPQPMSLHGTADDTRVDLAAGYGSGWQWRIVIEAVDADSVRMSMHNVVPPEHATDDIPAGAYPAMVTELVAAPSL